MSRLPDILLVLRLRGGLSLEALAERSGVPPARLAALESGAVPDPYFAEVASIASALGAPLDALAAGCSPGVAERAGRRRPRVP